MRIGTYYYPEQWPREQWRRDFDNMAQMGLQIVHMGEFAWFSMEPEPGRFELDWLDECVHMAQARGMKVILCTPTAAPPIWLTQQYPEILPVTAGGTKQHGGRRHYNPLAPAMREATERIVTALAERFGDHPAVIGWQIDNEYGLEFDQSPITHAAFQEWLRDRYGDIDTLNRAWGNQFWNQYYTSFGQILMPPSRQPRYDNPHHHLDASRFWSQVFAGFNRMQARILRPWIGTERFITTNFMPFHLDCNPGDFADHMDLFSWDSYPVSGWEKNNANEEYRIADPSGIGIMHDLMRSYTGRWGLMEVQPGTINWSGVPVLLYPGAVRLWLWTAWAHGAEFITTYRYRQPLWGIELFHHGLMQTDGVTPSEGGKQFMQVIQEMRELEKTSTSSASAPTPTAGLLIDFEQLWFFATLPQARSWDQCAWLRTWYAAIARLGMEVKILHPQSEWPGDLAMIVAPSVQMVDDRLIERFTDYARAGGHLLLTCRTGLMNRHGQLFEGPTAVPILPLIGATIQGYDGLPDGDKAHVEMDARRYPWNVWGDLVRPEEGTRVLACYADQFYAGTPAITQHDFGRGQVTYCGVCAEASLVEALVEKLVLQLKLPVSPLPRRVHVLQRDGFHIVLNYQTEPIQAPAPDDAQFIIGQRTVGPADVAIWRNP